jgi:hypothetical protein
LIEATKKVNTIMTTATYTHTPRGGFAVSQFGIPVRLLLAAFVALFLPTVASAQSANLWIDASGGTCTRQSTATGYSDAAACASIQAAVSACVPGDTIRMKAGTYGAQTITATKTAPGCTVIAESNTTVGRLITGGAWYELQNMTGAVNNGWSQSSGANNITCRNCHFSGQEMESYGSVNVVTLGGGSVSNIRWIGGSIRNFSCANCNSALYVGGPSTNLLVDGVTFDNVRNTGGVVNHFEVIRVDGNVNGFTLSRSSFTNSVTSTSTVFMSTWQGIKPQNLVFENNFFGDTSPAYFHFQANFQNQSNCSNWTFRYNTFTGPQGMMVDPASASCGSFSNVVWIGNLGPRGNCQGTASRSNVWYGSSGAACGATDKVVTASGLGGADGFRLTAGSPAIDAGGSGADCIATDHDGKSRQVGARCDAGAHEYGAAAAAVSPPTNLTVR